MSRFWKFLFSILPYNCGLTFFLPDSRDFFRLFRAFSIMARGPPTNRTAFTITISRRLGNFYLPCRTLPPSGLPTSITPSSIYFPVVLMPGDGGTHPSELMASLRRTLGRKVTVLSTQSEALTYAEKPPGGRSFYPVLLSSRSLFGRSNSRFFLLFRFPPLSCRPPPSLPTDFFLL